MAGIYIHIPFCTKRCYYCDFYFSLSLKNKNEIINAINTEIRTRKDYLDGQIINTIYFGGGTPSVLSATEINDILSTIRQNFSINPNAEITFEANPDDLNEGYLQELANCGINRLSIGIQSFLDTDLQFMNRRHNASDAINAVKNAQKCGFTNITIDLIYGLPNQTEEQWKDNISKALELNVQHISAYHLTIENNTLFGHQQKKGLLKPIHEETSFKFFKLLKEKLAENGFEQYEISNYCKPGYQSKHNSAYWFGEHYLGVGPSAHSFNEKTRQWNIANNLRYIKGIKTDAPEITIENLSLTDRVNDLLLTSLRTSKGIIKNDLLLKFDQDIYEKIYASAHKWISTGYILESETSLILSEKGFFVSDKIISELMII